MELGYDNERNESLSERDFFEHGYRATQPMETRNAPTERDFLNRGFAASQPRVDVVVTRNNNNVRKLRAASQPRETVVALAPVEVVPAWVAPPENFIPASIIPLSLRGPTASLVSSSNTGNTGRGMPWTAGPPALALAGAPLGALIVQVGRVVIAQIAIAGLEDVLGRAKKKYNQPNVQFRYRSGSSGELGAGNIVRPRGADGSVPEGTDPFESPDDFSLWRPWTWF